MNTEKKSNVDLIYDQVLEMATHFEFKPDERINAGTLARRLGTSRTPVREALNRLAAEGFFKLQTKHGFFCRSLEPQIVLDLYTARQAIETEAVRLAVADAKDEKMKEIALFLDDTEAHYDTSSSVERLAELDEEFHMRLVRLSGNKELERILANLNARIRYIRQIDMGERRFITPAAHRRILAALQNRDEVEAIAELRDHIGRRREEATEAVQRAYSLLYVPPPL